MEEFVIEWIKGDTRAAISAPAGSKLKNKLVKLAEENPGECDVIINKDGYAFGHIPIKYLHFYKPREMSEEKKEKQRAILDSNRQKKTENGL